MFITNEPGLVKIIIIADSFTGIDFIDVISLSSA